jgi:hypothetical protein
MLENSLRNEAMLARLRRLSNLGADALATWVMRNNGLSARRTKEGKTVMELSGTFPQTGAFFNVQPGFPSPHDQH